MKKLMRKMMGLSAAMVLGLTFFNFSTCCWFIFHQPKAPQNIN